jgi:hypothetical protein
MFTFFFDVCRVGIDNPTIEVRFENLNIDAEAYVGNRGIPTFTNFFSNKIVVRIFSTPALMMLSVTEEPKSSVHAYVDRFQSFSF